jgi:2-polyprenyl-3-methyl-5-hydroxy-6-metoxy-1,4-benzoquinol methylase
VKTADTIRAMSVRIESNDLRFAFGENWQRFLDGLSEERIAAGAASLREMLGVDRLDGLTVLDLGTGSGLFSLAAHRLGAVHVHSTDVDEQSVACAQALKERYAVGDEAWTVDRGDVLDLDFTRSLGTSDLVYAWGVLHHTGDMWGALANACDLVVAEGLLFISIYNDQGRRSSLWRSVKRTYNRLPSLLRAPFAAAVMAPHELRFALRSPRGYFESWRGAGERGMNRWTDIVDWVGGYPFEVARPEEVLDFCRARGFDLVRLKTVGGASGCNQFVFRRSR